MYMYQHYPSLNLTSKLLFSPNFPVESNTLSDKSGVFVHGLLYVDDPYGWESGGNGRWVVGGGGVGRESIRDPDKRSGHRVGG